MLDDSGTGLRRTKTDENRLAVRRPYVNVVPLAGKDESLSGLFLEYWDIFRCHKGTLILAAFLGLLGSLLFTLPQTPVYRARACLEIQNLNENFLNMRDVNPTISEGGSPASGSDLQTQVKILQSESVLEGVIAKLNLGQKLSTEEGRGRLSAGRKVLGLPEPGPDSTREELLQQVAKNLKVQTEPTTRLVEILYQAPDPQLAADFANTLTAEFIQQNLEARWKTTQQTGEWLTRQMDSVRIKLERSENELQSYSTSSGLVFTSDKGDVAEERLRQLQEEVSKAQADRVATQSKYELASTAPPESLPEVLDDKTLEDYQSKLTDLRRQLAELSSSLTPAHPSVKKVQAQLTTLEAALEKERANVIQRIRNEFETARRRENLLVGNYASQARLVSGQAAKVAHYNILKGEVDTNRQLYDSLLRQVQEAGMNSALGASNVRVVDPARPPARPYKPKVFVNLACGILAGVFLGAVFVALRGGANRSIQAPGETALLLDVPELGVIPSADAAGSRYFAYYRRSEHGARDSGLVPGRQEAGTRGSLSAQGESQSKSSSEDGTLQLGLATTGNGRRTTDKHHSGTSEDKRPRRVELITSQQPPSVLADSFRMVLASILYSGKNGDRPRAIVLTSANPREGKTTVASNLALAAAEIGQSVLLIDGDLRKGRLHEVFQVSNAWGFSDLLGGADLPKEQSTVDNQQSTVNSPYLTDTGPLTPFFLPTGCGGLYLLPAGLPASNISSLLYSPRAPEILKRMRQEFQTIIIDSPPLLNIPDARVLGRMADGVILVVRSTQTPRETVAAAAQRLREDGTRVLGTVLNDWDPRRFSRPGYAQTYPYYDSRGSGHGRS